MARGKPRHNQNKPQNNYGYTCPYYEYIPALNKWVCECNQGDITICKGNPHNCIKTKYKQLAIKRT